MATNVQYDPAIIQKSADKLYSEASSVITMCTFLGLVFGGSGGYALGVGMGQIGIIGTLGAVGLGAFGFAFGQSRAFMLRLKAQEALCQLHIEQNTRRP